MQRLFSNFANGWPGLGLLLQRALAGLFLLYKYIVQISDWHPLVPTPEIIGAVAGVFLLAGLLTPIAGIVATIAEAWVIISGNQEPLIPMMIAVLSATIAMIGPGAWSVDACIFGRKYIKTRTPPKGGRDSLH